LTVVLDASGAVEIALKNQKSEDFRTILQRADIILAPDTFVSEVTNVFWKYRKFTNFSDEICLKGIEFCINLIDDFVASKDLWRESYSEAIKNQTSVYAIFYLVAARRNSALIVSRDKKLNLIAEKEGLKISIE
jgi:predicted nucleic acid-binding protein